jgi:hypothetical protein
MTEQAFARTLELEGRLERLKLDADKLADKDAQSAGQLAEAAAAGEPAGKLLKERRAVAADLEALTAGLELLQKRLPEVREEEGKAAAETRRGEIQREAKAAA